MTVDIALFGIFLFTDLATVGIVAAVYGGKYRFRDGMVLGVKLPSYGAKDPEVQKLCEKYRRAHRRFYVWNLLAGAAVCFLSFWRFSILMALWTLWLGELCVFGPHLINRAHREMYEIKLARGWIVGMPVGMDTPRQGGAPVLMDEDLYWKTGWYRNPDNPKLWVPDRMCSTNYTVNLERTAGKVFMGVTIGGTILLTVGLCIMFLCMDFIDMTLEIGDTQVCVKAAMYDLEFPRDEIQSVEVVQELPAGELVRTNGAATSEYRVGKFSGKAAGECRLYIYNGYKPILKICLPDYTVYINSKRPGEVEAWMRKLE